MLQIILVLAVACIAAYFIASSRKSKVEEISKNTPAPLNPTFDPSFPVPFPVEGEVVATAEQVEELKEAKKVVKKKSTPKKKASK